jgi:hypothetical protein
MSDKTTDSMSSTFGVSSDEIKKYPWQDVIKASATKEMFSYHSLFNEAVKNCQNVGDLLGVKVYRFLGGLTSWRLNYDDPSDKYLPLFDGAISPADYQDEDLDVLEEILPEILDAEFKSRAADLLWLYRKKKKPDHARIATESFLIAASALEDGRLDCIFTDRIKRAVQLSAILGKEKDLFKSAVSHVNVLILKYSQTGKQWVCGDLMNILLEFGEGNATELSTLCGNTATHFQAQSDFIWAQYYWRLQSQWLRLAKDQDASRLALVNEAEAIVLEADAATKRKIPSFGAAKGILARGIEALRRVQGDKNRIEELRQLHAEYGKKSLLDMGTIQIPMPDGSQAVQTAISAVAGKCLQQGLLSVATFPPTNVKLLRQNLIQGNHPEFLLIGAAYCNEDGKTVGSTEGVSPTEIQEAHVMAKMFLMARTQWDYMAQNAILPALAKMNSEHNVGLKDFVFILLHNPFVAPGREDILARGLLAGFRGDWLTVAHLMPPQIEHMLRFILAQQGKLTSSLDHDGIEKEYSLGKILCDAPDLVAAIEASLGEDLVFDLRGVLIEKPGANLRNRMAHGLMNGVAFYDTTVVYVWWLVLKLCSLPIFSYLEQQKAAKNTGAKS